MSVQCEFHSMDRDFVEARFFSKSGKSVVLHVTDTDEYSYRPFVSGLGTKFSGGTYVGVLSVAESQKKNGWAPLQSKIRISTGWKIGIIDINNMVEQYKIWRLHNL